MFTDVNNFEFCLNLNLAQKYQFVSVLTDLIN